MDEPQYPLAIPLIGYRIFYQYAPSAGAEPRPASIVVNAPADWTLQQVLDHAGGVILAQVELGHDTGGTGAELVALPTQRDVYAAAIGGYSQGHTL